MKMVAIPELPTLKPAKRVAARALVLAAVELRANVEANPSHPRSEELCPRALGWLESLDLGAEIEPLERDILETPLGSLRPEQRTDANWAREGAALLAWALGLVDPSPASTFAGSAAGALRLLHDTARELVEAATLRPADELAGYGRHILLVKHHLRDRSFRDKSDGNNFAADILYTVLCQTLAKLGLQDDTNALKKAGEMVDEMPAADREHAGGLFFVRAVAIGWLLGETEAYGD